MKILKQTQLQEAASILKNGGVIAFPTETVFGLGVVFDDEKAYKKLVEVKRRPPDKPFTMMLADPEDCEKYAELNETSKILISKFMPGQFTLLINGKKDLPSWCVAKEGTVGMRVPDSEIIRDLIRLIGKPLLVPSANKSGESPANTSKEAELIFKNEIDAIIEGESTSKTPSTIILVEGNNIKMIREGIVSLNEIQKELAKWKL